MNSAKQRVDNFWGLLIGRVTKVQTNIQARRVGIGTWKSYGDDITHRDAAEAEAHFWWYDHTKQSEIETRNEFAPDIIFNHIVTREITYRVVCLRDDQITDAVK